MRKLALLFASCLACSLPVLAGLPLPRVESVTTDKVDFAPGGTIRIVGSTGELNIEGWDQPSVEVTVTRYTFNNNEARARQDLDKVQVSKPVVSGTELTLTTRHRKTLSVNTDYRIRVPRNSKLVIRHDTGDVVVYDVAGDIDATAKVGQIVLQVPAAGHYDIDARNKMGGDIYSDFTGKMHNNPLLLGQSLLAEPAGATCHLHLRVTVGGIAIQKMS